MDQHIVEVGDSGCGGCAAADDDESLLALERDTGRGQFLRSLGNDEAAAR
jgi:hypothetical protein